MQTTVFLYRKQSHCVSYQITPYPATKILSPTLNNPTIEQFPSKHLPKKKSITKKGKNPCLSNCQMPNLFYLIPTGPLGMHSVYILFLWRQAIRGLSQTMQRPYNEPCGRQDENALLILTFTTSSGQANHPKVKGAGCSKIKHLTQTTSQISIPV